MNVKNLLGILVLFCLIGFGIIYNNDSNTRKFEFSYSVTFEPTNGKKFEAWIPYPKSNEIQNIKINSIKNNNKFSIDSIKLIYSLPEKSFILINDDENKIYLAFIKKINIKNKISENDLKNYLIKSNSEIRDTLYSSYDIYLSEKYEIKVFQNTIERFKNNFR